MLNNIPLTNLKGVGPQIQKKLAKLDLSTVFDLLFLLPLRYEDRSKITPIKLLKFNQCGLVEGEIISNEIKYGSQKNLICYVQDTSGSLVLRFLHFTRWQQKQFIKGKKIRIFGELRWSKYGPEMVHPDYKIFTNELPPLVEELTPVYPTTAGLTQHVLRKITGEALKYLETRIGDCGLRIEKNSRNKFPSLRAAGVASSPSKPWRSRIHELALSPRWIATPSARNDVGQILKYLHRPPVDADLKLLENYQHPLQKQLIFEELLAHQLSLKLSRRNLQQNRAQALIKNQLFQKLTTKLPFTLTSAQKRVIQEISNDLTKAQPMLRLLQGDVGSGKTIVAVAALLQAYENGMQAAIMAPTEILAEQHFTNLSNWLDDFSINLVFLSGKTKLKDRNEILTKIESGKANIIIGTHALFQDKVKFF